MQNIYRLRKYLPPSFQRLSLPQFFCSMDKKGKRNMKVLQTLLELVAIAGVIVACCHWPQTIILIASGIICISVAIGFIEAVFNTK